MSRIQLLLVDQQPIFRQGIRRVFDGSPDIGVVAESSDLRAAGAVATRLQPDVVLVLLHAKAAEELDAVRELRCCAPGSGIIVLGEGDEAEGLLRAARAGAAGFARTGIAPDELLNLVRRVASGSYPIDAAVVGTPRVAAQMLSQFRAATSERAEAWPGFAPLSNRELQVLDCIARGMANKEIAQQLTISGQTVKNHITAILSKLHAGDRTAAVIEAMRHGWVTAQRHQ